jgi:hypothetical protein
MHVSERIEIENPVTVCVNVFVVVPLVVAVMLIDVASNTIVEVEIPPPECVEVAAMTWSDREKHWMCRARKHQMAQPAGNERPGHSLTGRILGFGNHVTAFLILSAADESGPRP